MIKVITFDLDGVYFPNGKANFISALTKLGINEDEAKRVFLKSTQMNEEYKKGKMSDSDFWSWAVEEWKINNKWEEIVQTMIDNYDIDERIVDIVKQVRQKGYKTAICTNNFPARINGLHKRFKFLDNFDIKVISYQVGFAKPEIEIYQELVRASAVDASSIVYADDHEECLKNAKALGMSTYFYDNFENYKKYLENVGVNF